MNSLPLHFAYLALSQLAPPADFRPPAELVPIQPPSMQAAASDTAAPEDLGDRAAANPFRQTNTSNTESSVPSHVVPATGISSLAPVSSEDGVALATTLIQDSMNAVNPASFDGNATSLLAAIQHVADTSLQRQSVIAYWRLSAAISRYAFAEQEVTFFQQLNSAPHEGDQAIFQAALAAAIARHQATAEAVTLSQFDLLEQSYSSDTAALPWPDDTPLVGAYRTKFESLFRDRTPPITLQRIHRVLPSTKRVIEARANAVLAARKARDASYAVYQEGRLPMRSLLDTCARLRTEQEAFLAAVLRYNEFIAEYALSVVGPAADPATVVATLIKWEEQPAITLPVNQGVQPASAEEPIQAPAEQPAPATTVSPPPPAQPQVAPTTPTLESPLGTRSVLRGVKIAH